MLVGVVPLLLDSSLRKGARFEETCCPVRVCRTIQAILRVFRFARIEHHSEQTHIRNAAKKSIGRAFWSILIFTLI